jgi:hypothetical protein
MLRDKKAAAAAMKLQMTMLRLGGNITANQHRQPAREYPTTGRGGGTNKYQQGREGGGRTGVREPANRNTTKTTSATMITEEESEANQPTNGTDNNAPTVSDLTEPTTGTQDEEMDMEEDDDGLGMIMMTGIPAHIPTITPNIQWMKDIEKDLPKTRYGIKIKIKPENTPTKNQSITIKESSKLLHMRY